MVDTTRSSVFYDRTAEYVAVLLKDAWTSLGPAVVDALQALDVSYPIVDIGAGVGDGTRLLACAFPNASIVALEPNVALRTALLTWLVRDDSLSGRVTVRAEDVLTAALPEKVSAFLLANVIGHFDKSERTDLWRLIARHLVPTGRAVVNLSPPTRPESIAQTPMSEATIGGRRYSGSASAEPTGVDSVTWTMSYSITDSGAVVDDLTASDVWYVFEPDQLAKEVAAHGLRADPGDPRHGVWIIRHRGD